MPSKPPAISEASIAQLQTLGAQLRSQRKALGLNATQTATAARLSRVTLHRIEKGEPSVTMGAWCSVMEALGLTLQPTPERADWLPARVPLADYPLLRALAWQVQGTDTLSLMEALDLYERNALQLDMQAMPASEQALLQALRVAFGRGGGGGNNDPT